MARLAGFEPATYGLEVRCSIQLSYRRISLNQVRYFTLIFRRFIIFIKNDFNLFLRDQPVFDKFSQLGFDPGYVFFPINNLNDNGEIIGQS